jgi:hypothetical protein
VTDADDERVVRNQILLARSVSAQPEYAEYPKKPHGERSELAKRQAKTEYNAQARRTPHTPCSMQQQACNGTLCSAQHAT